MATKRKVERTLSTAMVITGYSHTFGETMYWNDEEGHWFRNKHFGSLAGVRS